MPNSNVIKIKKGLNIRVKGTASLRTEDALSIVDYAVKPTDYVGVVAKLHVKEGEAVKAGTVLFHDKNNEQARFVSPVSGTVKEIVRGAKRAIQAVVIASDGKHESESFPAGDPSKMSREEVMKVLVESGALTMIRQRPFGIVPTAESKPKAVFISAFSTAPLAPNYDYMLKGKEKELQCGIDALKTAVGKVHLSLHTTINAGTSFDKLKNVELHYFEGKHPTGLVGTQIAHIDPINKGENVWTIDLQDVAILGSMFITGAYKPQKMVALAGSVVDNPQYYNVIEGANVETITKKVKADNVRFVSGDILTGTKIEPNGYLSAHNALLSVLPEGNQYDFMGWLMPGLKKYSFSHTFLSGFRQCNSEGSKKYLEKCTLNTGLHGGVRPFIVTGEFEKVFAMDIYPLQLIKACIIGDIELMENLGIYEVEPEDFALCEFIDASKNEIQTIIREGLELVRTN